MVVSVQPTHKHFLTSPSTYFALPCRIDATVCITHRCRANCWLGMDPATPDTYPHKSESRSQLGPVSEKYPVLCSSDTCHLHCSTALLVSGAVGDRDLCLLNTMRYESEASSGSSCVGGIFNSEEGTCIPLPPYALRSGPRETIYWNPKDVCIQIPNVEQSPGRIFKRRMYPIEFITNFNIYFNYKEFTPRICDLFSIVLTFLIMCPASRYTLKSALPFSFFKCLKFMVHVCIRA